MVYQPVLNVAKLELNFRLQGEDLVNILHIQAPAAIGALEVAAIAGFGFALWNGNLQVFMSNEIALESVVCTDLTIEDGQQFTFVPQTPSFGLVASQSMPNNIALVASHRTGRSGRSYRGRTYLGGIPETAVAQNQVSAQYASDIAGIWELWRTQTEDDGYFHVVVSRVQNKIVLPEAIATPVRITQVGRRIDTQRRRLPRNDA
jgi:hypothetical protein